MSHRVTLIPGDGIGPEIADAVLRVLTRAGVDIEWDRHEVGLAVYEREGTPLPSTVMDSIRQNRVALKGPVGTPIAGGFSSVNVEIRRSLNLYANLRPVFSLPGVPTRFEAVSLIVIRENTEDL